MVLVAEGPAAGSSLRGRSTAAGAAPRRARRYRARRRRRDVERVGEGPDPPMSDDAFEEVGLHAARSTSAIWSASAASQPERHLSSWKP